MLVRNTNGYANSASNRNQIVVVFHLNINGVTQSWTDNIVIADTRHNMYVNHPHYTTVII